MKYEFLGWYNDPSEGHDKIWGMVRQQGQAITFWGRRTAKLTFKQVDDATAESQIRQKRSKGYRDTTPEILMGLDPTFQDRFDEGVILAVCGNFFHTIKTGT